MNNKVDIELRDFAKYNVRIINGEKFLPITNVLPITSANPQSLVFISLTAKNKEELLLKTAARSVICSFIPSDESAYSSKCLIITENPRLLFAQVVGSAIKKVAHSGIHPTAVVDEGATIAPNVSIGANAYIGKSQIGEGTTVHPNATIYDNVTIGRNCEIHSGAVIGSTGFGYVTDADNTPIPFPQLGGVVIGNFVDIGANTSIDRGALQDTVIGNYCKIDNNVHIAHNDIIGERTMICAGATLGGSVVVGSDCWLSANTTTLHKISIGNNAFVGIGSVIIRNVGEGARVFGNPATKIKF